MLWKSFKTVELLMFSKYIFKKEKEKSRFFMRWYLYIFKKASKTKNFGKKKKNLKMAY